MRAMRMVLGLGVMAVSGCMDGGTREERVTATRMAIETGLRVEYHHGEDTNPNDNQIKPYFRIVNDSSASVPLSELKLRYFYSREGSSEEATDCYWAQLGCGNIGRSHQPLVPAATGANRYLELSFGGGAGSLGAHSNTGDIKVGFHKNDWTNYSELDDFSYVAGQTQWANALKVALYRNGVLVSGSEPGGGGPGGTGGAAASGGTGATTGGSLGQGGAGGSGAEQTVELSVEVPIGTGLHELALGATESLIVGDGVRIAAASSQADVASTGTQETNLGADAVIGGDVWSVGSVMLRERGTVQGNLTTEGSFGKQNLWTVSGTIREGATLTPPKRYVWQVAFPPPLRPVSVLRQQTEPLPPGSYDSISVQEGGRLELVAGTYYARSLTAESGSVLSVDASAGPVFLYVMDGLTYRGSIQGVAARDFFVGYAGQNVADVDSPFKGTIVAPRAMLRLSPVDGSGREGSFFAKSIWADARNPITFTPFGHWDWIFPPELILECVSWGGHGYAAGIFGYNNSLDITVTIPEGARNSITAATRRAQGPLEVFDPGEHRNVYWLPFVGDAIEWTLSGKTSVVDDAATGCTLDNYHLVPQTVTLGDGLPPLPQDRAALRAPEGVVPDAISPAFMAAPAGAAGGSGTDATSGTQALAASTLAVLEYGVWMELGAECWFGSYDVDTTLTVNGQSATFNVVKDIPAPPAPVPALASQFFSMPITVGPLDAASYSITVKEHDSGLCGGDHQLFHGGPWPLNILSLPPLGSAPWDLATWNCTNGDNGWKFCFYLTASAQKKVCAEWPVQFLDAALGEDRIATTDVTRVPASNAVAHLSITDAEEPYAERNVVLDQDGCVGGDDAPTLAQLMTPAGANASIHLDWQGVLRTPAPNGQLEVIIDRLFGNPQQVWQACGCPGTAFELPTKPANFDPLRANPYAYACPNNACQDYAPDGYYSPAAMPGTLDTGTGVPPDRFVFIFGSANDQPTVFSRTGGVVSELLRLHQFGGTDEPGRTDMGIVSGKIHLWPESLPGFIVGSAHHAPAKSKTGEEFVNLRPNWTSWEKTSSGGTVLESHESDSHRKFTVMHEFAHALQGLAVGNLGGGYGLTGEDPQGNPITSVDLPSLPPECRCSHIGNEFSPAHCLGSPEVSGAAINEGYSHFFSARTWNRPDQNDCTFLYVKKVLAPACPAGLSADKCVPLTQALLTPLYPDPKDRDHLLTLHGSWVLITPPVPISCAQVTRWRNQYCASTKTTPDMKDLGVEGDWLQFHWGLTTGTNPWTIQKYDTLLTFACNLDTCAGSTDPACSFQRCAGQTRTSREAWKTFDVLISRKPAQMELSVDEWTKLQQTGVQYGVSQDLSAPP